MAHTSTALTAHGILVALHEHQDVLEQYSVQRIGLFGSYARGEQQPGSDLDFLVEFREPTLEHFLGLVDYLEGLFGRRIDVLTLGGVANIRVPRVAEEIRKSVVYA